MAEGNQGKGDMNEHTAEELAVFQKRMAGAAVSKMVASAIGDMVTLYSKDSAHKHFAFADTEWKILPPIINEQYHIETADDLEYGTLRPVGLVTWAKVSDELDDRLSSQVDGQIVRLRPAEWSCGENVWLVDVVGTPEGIAKALKSISENQLSGMKVKVPTRSADGKLVISDLDELISKSVEKKL